MIYGRGIYGLRLYGGTEGTQHTGNIEDVIVFSLQHPSSYITIPSSATDSLTLSSALSAHLLLRLSLSDSFTLLDTSSVSLITLSSITDILSFSDTASITLATPSSVVDFLLLSSAVYPVVFVSSSITENIDTSAYIPAYTIYLSAIEDVFQLGDSAVVVAVLLIPISDHITITDKARAFYPPIPELIVPLPVYRLSGRIKKR